MACANLGLLAWAVLAGAASVTAFGAAAPNERVIADFEGGSAAPFTNGKYTTEDAPQGKGAVRITSGYILMEGPQDWSGYDYIKFDTYNPTDRPVRAYLEVHDKQTTGYWTRVNQPSVIPPGKSTMSFRTDCYVGEKSRPGRQLLRDQITKVAIGAEGNQIVIDNIRLEKLDTDAVRFKGLLALDFGTADSPVMEGYERCTQNDGYSAQRGYGWVNTQFWRSFNVLQPDALCQDFVVPTNGTFRVNVPDGKYHVVMNLDSPGGFWGEPQVYTSRTVTANGQTVVSETMDYAKFLPRYFRNAHQEDLPGLDTFRQYVEPMFDVKAFDVEVKGGRLELGFSGDRWANCLSYMVVYRAGQAEVGERFLAWTQERRKVQFENAFKQIEPKGTGTPSPSPAYVLFTRDPMLAVNAHDGPASAAEAIPQEGLTLTVAKGEEGTLNLAMRPGVSAGAVDLEVSPLRTAQGRELPREAVRPGWIEYRITRIENDGSVYSVAPRYWRPVPAPDAPGVTRRFWIRVKPSAKAEAGEYRGQLTVKPAKGEARTVPLTIRVLPFALDEIADVAVGPWGSGINLPWDGDDPRTATWNWEMFEKSLDAIREAGCTSFSGRPTLRVTAKDGKVSLDAELADREMALIRSKGFTQLISSYGWGSSLGYNLYGTASGPDLEAARRAGFADMDSFLKAVYGAIDAHAAKRNWPVVAWNLCDEPLEDAVPGAVANARAHRKAAEESHWTHTTFMGATSLAGEKPDPRHVELAKALAMPSLNMHDAKALEVLRQAGNRFSFYNDGNRWTYGRYMKALVAKHGLALRLTWHFNVVAGDPYYALDSREDDYCWYNTDERQTMVPSIDFLRDIVPGLNDYRYLSTLQRLVREQAGTPAAAVGQKVLDEMLGLEAGSGRTAPADPAVYGRDRERVMRAILGLL